ncbi:MAG: hypothetical protein H6839_18000 [Planctomycetes bacterium]|nr:hypothetical protein [Planctomycetota bacterium]
MNEAAPNESSGTAVWLVPLIILPLLIGALVVGYLLLPTPGAKSGNGAANSTPAIPSLGSRGHPVEDSPNEPAPANNDESTDPSDGGEAADGGSEPEPEYANTEREIDIWLSNLAIATRANDRRGIALQQEMLGKARPDELVDQRVRNALDSEVSAVVRIQYFLAYHEAPAKHDWAMHVYDTRTAKFMGTDDQLAGGEAEELKLIASHLFDSLSIDWHRDEAGDTRVMALLRNLLDTEKPEWLQDVALQWAIMPMIKDHLVSFARAVEQELRNLLLRRTAALELREYFFWAYVLTFDPHTGVFLELARSEWWDYASALLPLYGRRTKPGELRIGGDPLDGIPEWSLEVARSEELPKLFEQLLQGTLPAEHKRLLIQRIAQYNVPNGRAMIEAGLARKDANYPDYLTAFGSFAADDADLQRLTAAANDPDIPSAAGAIEGLRQSSLNAADAELRKVLEQGLNLGVKSQALGALLSRASDKSALLEEYLDPNKDASLRAVAVSAVPIDDVTRLQRVAEDDISPTVRLAAVNRVGGIVPATSQERKDLHGWFVKIKTRDSSPVIRAAARKYAEATED